MALGIPILRSREERDADKLRIKKNRIINRRYARFNDTPWVLQKRKLFGGKSLPGNKKLFGWFYDTHKYPPFELVVNYLVVAALIVWLVLAIVGSVQGEHIAFPHGTIHTVPDATGHVATGDTGSTPLQKEKIAEAGRYNQGVAHATTYLFIGFALVMILVAIKGIAYEMRIRTVDYEAETQDDQAYLSNPHRYRPQEANIARMKRQTFGKRKRWPGV